MTQIQKAEQSITEKPSWGDRLLWMIPALPPLLLLLSIILLFFRMEWAFAYLFMSSWLLCIPAVVVVHIMFITLLLKGRLSIVRQSVLIAVALTGIDLLMFFGLMSIKIWDGPM